MKKQLSTNIASAILLGLMSFTFIHAQTTPETLVANLYTAWDGNTTHSVSNNCCKMLKSLTQLQKYFSPTIAKKIFKADNSEENGLDADILYDTQDIGIIKNFRVGKFQAKDTKTGFLNVSFTNFKQKQTIKFLLEKLANGWRVYDLEYEHGKETFTLKSILDAP